ncbi:MAG TPA: ribonuclease H-like domain-containing protein [Actinomycetota bacterium]|nr:ribonuclease H-like domain-containing protein [Actinomycetota bacterium]
MVGYLDIETSFTGELTVVGLLRAERGLIQIVGRAITRDAVDETLRGIDTICTFNGESFDLPVLRRALGIGLLERCRSFDLSVECRRMGLRGGLKRIEDGLSIPRRLRGVTGYDAMVLWDRWEQGDREALETLLEYNRDDVINLRLLERRLRGDLEMPQPVEQIVVGA